MIKTKLDVMRIRYTQLITDPFPEHSFYQSISQQFTKLEKLFGWVPKAPEPISIHKAYKMGYDKAYKEIEAALE